MPTMRMFLLAGALLLPAMLFAAACGDDDDGPSGTGIDEDYLRAICKGTSDVSNALVTATTADAIADVIRDFIEVMKDANPPADLVEYNDAFVKYLEDAVDDPTSVATRPPPLPANDIQRRLADKELSIDECKDGTFFSRTGKG